jgi:endo-1,4-beta-xylanase
MTHYAGQCYAWDVVNEALNEDGTFRESVFFTTLGSAYIPLSFRIAASVDPSTKLYYNDFNLETSAAKADGAVKIVKLIQDAGVKIDGVGFQAHLNVGQTPSRQELAATLKRFAALGVEVAYTELDIAHPSLPASDADREQQAKDYVAAVGSCLDVEACVGVTVWQFTDKYSWVPSTFPGKGDACLYTADYKKKPAYDAVLELLRGAAAAAGGAGSGSGSGSGNSTGSDSGSNSTAVAGRPATEITVKASGGASATAALSGASVVMGGGFAGLVWTALAALLVL